MSAGLVLQGGQSQAKGGGHWLSERKEEFLEVGSRGQGWRNVTWGQFKGQEKGQTPSVVEEPTLKTWKLPGSSCFCL